MEKILRRVISGLLLLLTSCSTSKLPGDLASIKSGSRSVEVVAILGTNDLHGSLLPLKMRAGSVEYEAGGIATLASHIKLLRSEWGSKLLWVDAGDEFQGTLESNSEQGAPVVDALNALGLNAATFGNHEFDFGKKALSDRIAQAHYPYIASNITGLSEGNLFTRKLFDVGSLKIGVIGLTTLATPKITHLEAVRDLQFEDLKNATLRESRALRQEGAQIVLLATHTGIHCRPGRASLNSTLRKPTDPQGPCDEHGETVRLLTHIPAGTVDAVITGHSHTIVHHWVAGVPVIQGGAHGRYFNIIYLSYDTSEKKLLTDKTRIEGPVPVCPAVFQNQGDCNVEKGQGKVPLVLPKFHGKTIRPDSETEAKIGALTDKYASARTEKLAKISRYIPHNRYGESELGNWVADAIRQQAKTDFALINHGMIRTDLDQGTLRYETVFRMIPYENRITVLKVSGNELRRILRAAESGVRGFSAVSGLKLRLIDLAYDAKLTDGLPNRLIDVRRTDGNSIQDQKQYTLAIPEYLARGGDDMSVVMSQLPSNRIQSSSAGQIRDAFLSWVKLASLDGPFAPRLKFEKQQRNGRKHRKKAKAVLNSK